MFIIAFVKRSNYFRPLVSLLGFFLLNGIMKVKLENLEGFKGKLNGKFKGFILIHDKYKPKIHTLVSEVITCLKWKKGLAKLKHTFLNKLSKFSNQFITN